MAHPRPALGLPRSRRIQRARDFAELRQRGRRITSGCLIANWDTLPPDQPSRLGVVTGRKLGSAVVRSRARRLLREAFRLHQHELVQPVAAVLVARASIVGKGRAQVERDYLEALRRAALLRRP